MRFDFGDVWMVDQIFKQSGLDIVFEKLIPESSLVIVDTLKTLVSYNLLESYSYNSLADWSKDSYARVLYPNALISSPRISEFLAKIGSPIILDRFFRSYLNAILKKQNISDKISIAALIDSTGIQNDIHTYLTAVNNHNGVVSNEI
jgi:hypothetical protein